MEIIYIVVGVVLSGLSGWLLFTAAFDLLFPGVKNNECNRSDFKNQNKDFEFEFEEMYPKKDRLD